MEKIALTLPGVDGRPTLIPVPSGIPTGEKVPENVFEVAVTLLSITGIVLALIFVIYAGIRWATSGGDKQKVEGARKMIIYSIIGLIVIVLSYAIIGVFGQLVGVRYFERFGSPDLNQCQSYTDATSCRANGCEWGGPPPGETCISN